MTARPTSTTPSAEAIPDARDARQLLHPFADFTASAGPIISHAVDDVRIADVNGKVYIDAAAGLANVNLGYARPELVATAAQSMERLPFATLFFGRGHVPGVRLAERLEGITPPGISRFHLTVGGSDANETAIKLARRYFVARGEPQRQVIVGRRKGYHGTSLGALSATGQPPFHERFGPMAPGFVHVDQPTATDEPLAQLEATIDELGSERIAAFMAEPVSLPAGVAVPPDDYWPGVREICDRHGLLLILDEVICGFGRTGQMFAAEHWGLRPDLLVMSKGITSGYAPLGAVGVNDRVADRLGDDGSFLHGFTGGGHPVACDVALATIDILEAEDLSGRADRSGRLLKDRLEAAGSSTGRLSHPRGLGLLAAVDIVRDRDGGSAFDPSLRVGDAVGRALEASGVIVRQFGETVAFAPPLTIGEDAMHAVVDTLSDVVRRLDPETGELGE